MNLRRVDKHYMKQKIPQSIDYFDALDAAAAEIMPELADDSDEVAALLAPEPIEAPEISVEDTAVEPESLDASAIPADGLTSPSAPAWPTFAELPTDEGESPSSSSSSATPRRRGFHGGPSSKPSDLASFISAEVVIGPDGQPRQAGTDPHQKWGPFITRIRTVAEKNLFFFTKGILNRHFLTGHFHKDVCDWLQVCPPFRKLLLMPREHAKTAIVAGGLPPHIVIQPAETNIYFPGLKGTECRILLCGETMKMAQKNLRVIEAEFEANKLFRVLWPHCIWPGRAKSMSKSWNSEEMIVPRDTEFPDPTIRAIGVDGAVTGSRPNVEIKDDIISLKAANSDVEMAGALEWHKVSRALLDTYEIETGLQSLEYLIGTRWAVFDLYSHTIDNDPSVEVNMKWSKIIDNGKVLWPEKHTEETIDALRKEFGSMFYLLHLNSAADPSLTDFDMDLIRAFYILDGKVIFEGDDRDIFLVERENFREDRRNSDGELPTESPVSLYGVPLRPETQDLLFNRQEYFRLRVS